MIVDFINRNLAVFGQDLDVGLPWVLLKGVKQFLGIDSSSSEYNPSPR